MLIIYWLTVLEAWPLSCCICFRFKGLLRLTCSALLVLVPAAAAPIPSHRTLQYSAGLYVYCIQCSAVCDGYDYGACGTFEGISGSWRSLERGHASTTGKYPEGRVSFSFSYDSWSSWVIPRDRYGRLRFKKKKSVITSKANRTCLPPITTRTKSPLTSWSANPRAARSLSLGSI